MSFLSQNCPNTPRNIRYCFEISTDRVVPNGRHNFHHLYMSVPLDSELLEVRDAYLICLYTATQTKGSKFKK